MNVRRDPGDKPLRTVSNYYVSYMILDNYTDHVNIRLISSTVLKLNTIPTMHEVKAMETVIAEEAHEHMGDKIGSVAILGWNEVQ
jgi:hypothetical protein